MSNLLQRVITGIIIAAITIFIAYKGNIYFNIFSIILGALTYSEYIKITQKHHNKLLIISGAVFYLFFALLILFKILPQNLILYVCLSSVILYFITYIQHQANIWMPLGFIYNSLPVISLIFIREKSFAYIIYLFLIIWSTDIGGYIFGKIIGGKKIAPRISPKKTYAGAIGGILLAFIASFIYLYLTQNVTQNLIIGIFVLSIISQYGDLLESYIKRKFNIKDSGNILPGHGGVLDRVDGLMIASIFFALFLGI